MATAQGNHVTFHCYGCGASAPAEPRGRRCGRCGEPFSLRTRRKIDTDILRRMPSSMWDYFALLPIESRSSVVSLCEGATPVLHAERLSKSSGLNVILKNETGNPTGSFKDRQVSVGISHARACGYDTVAVVSSGNVACAAAAYAARAGMHAVLFMHGMAAPGKIAQAAAYGATVMRVATDSARDVFNLCIAACDTFGWYHLSTSGMHEPYNVEGAKTIAYELYQQCHGNLPDWIVVPVGGGGLLGGIWRGLLDISEMGLIERVPRLAGVQASGCAPLKRAIDTGQPFLETLQHPWPNPKSVAGGIADDILFDGHTALPAIRSTRGAAIAVTDDEIIAAELVLAQQEGVLCDPCSACCVAAFRYLPGADAGTRVCCVITGTGIKDLTVLQDRIPPVPTIAASLDEVERVLAGKRS